MRATGDAIGRDFTSWDTFLPKWYAAHPTAWVATNLADAAAWTETPWRSVNTFFASDWPENYYDYGGNLTIAGNSVCLYGRPYCDAALYAQFARNLAIHGLERVDEKRPWLPLGVFVLANAGETAGNVVIQLAVNHAGSVRGNYYRAVDKKILLVQGSIFRDTQRIAWIIGGNKDVVFDTGLCNLTHRETPVLVHFGPEATDQLLLIRMKRP